MGGKKSIPKSMHVMSLSLALVLFLAILSATVLIYMDSHVIPQLLMNPFHSTLICTHENLHPHSNRKEDFA